MNTQIIGPGTERKRITIYNSINDIPEEYFKNEEFKDNQKIKKQQKEQTPTITAPLQYFYLTKEMYNEALERIKKDYANNETLLKIEWNEKENVAKGSNLYYIALINTIFKNQGIRTATQAELEEILRNKTLDLNGTYEDSGIVLRSLTSPNGYLAKQIGKQIAKIQGKNVDQLDFPIYIPACDLELTKDSGNLCNLGFKILDSGIYAPILNSDDRRKFSSLDIDPKTGFPTKFGNGNRTLHTRNVGLSRVCLYKYLDLGSSNVDLSDSDENGRVICVKTNGDTK